MHQVHFSDFTPEKLAHLERVRSAIKAGEKTLTQAEIREHFLKKWESWPESPQVMVRSKSGERCGAAKKHARKLM